MPSFSTHTVVAISSEREGLQRVELDSGRRAYVLTRLIGPVAVGDRVVVNTTAVDRELGTGGWDVVHWNLARDEWSEPGPGHVMKLRYTSLQADTGVVEEDPAYAEPQDLGGMPVVACMLHSQLPCVAAAFKHLAPDARLVYVMTDAGALPLALSDLTAALRNANLLDATVTCGHAFGGDFEAVNVLSALDVAKSVVAADAVAIGTGPGVVGTASRHGFSALEVAGIIDFADRARARPIVPLRWSGVDPRPRHRGVSHHSVAALQYAHAHALVPVPAGEPTPEVDPHEVVEVDVPDIVALLGRHGIEVTSMGRGPAEDPGFFRYAGAGGVLAAQLISQP